MVISYIKVPATHYALHFQQGKVRREGHGLSFFYYAPTSTIMALPTVSTDSPFVFHETTADFQAVTIQGQLTYRIVEPKKLAMLLDFSVGPDGRTLGDGGQKLQERLVQATQVAARSMVQQLALRQVLTSATSLSSTVQESLVANQSVASLGIEVLGVSVLSIKPTPEMAKALEAEAREALQRQSDEAIYARRNAAVEQERRIRESELNTEIAVEEKQRQIRETKMAAEIAVEEQRAHLIDQRVENERKDADSRAYGLRAMVEPLQNVDWRKLMFLSGGGTDARQMIAMAFQDLASNAQKIGELNITPELLTSLIGKSGK